MPTLVGYSFLGYWWSIIIKIPKLLFQSHDFLVTLVGFLLFIVTFYNKEIFAKLNDKWTGLSPWWASIPIGIIFYMVL